MSCKYQNYVDDMLSGKLSEVKERELLTHADQCSECNGRIKNIERMDALIKETVTHSTYRDFSEKTMKAVEDSRNVRGIGVFFIKHRKAMLSFAVVLLAAVIAFSYNILTYSKNPAGITGGQDIQKKPGDYNIYYDFKSNFPLTNVNYGSEAEGYIMGIDGDRFLVIGTNINLEYKLLQAIWINVAKTDNLYNNLSIGTKVKYVSDGPTFTTYPGQGGIKIIDIIQQRYPDIKSRDIDIINTGLNVLKDIDTSGKYYICSINNLQFGNGIWTINIVKDRLGEKDNLSYYTIRIQDEDKKIEDITIYQ